MIARVLGEPSSLVYADAPDPPPGAGEVVIDVHAAGCNFPDILIVQGKYQKKPPLPFIPGAEVAGVVSAVGDGVRDCSVGQRVFAMMSGGGYAERVAVPATAVYRLPVSLSFEEGAAFGLVYQTSYCALVHRAGLRTGETLLVHAAAGGVGLAAVQIGRALGARVMATAGSADKLEIARAAGAEWMTELLAMVETGALRPLIFKSFPLARAADALAAIGSRESYGKVVLVP